MSAKSNQFFTYILLLLVAIGAIFFVTRHLMDINNLMIHPHNLTEHMERLVTGTGFSLNDFITPFQEYDHRARFLTYFVLILDFHTRLFLYNYFPILPTLSITWIFTVLIGPCLLFLVCRNLKMPAYVSFSAVLVYITSTGVLSGLFMFFMPGKPLTNVVFLAILECLTRSDLHHINMKKNYGRLYLWCLILIGCFLDELFFVAVAVIPIIFIAIQSTFTKVSSGLILSLRESIKMVMPPTIIFFLLILFVVPSITQYFYGYSLDYIGALKNTVKLGDPLPDYQFGLSNIITLFYTLLGVSLVPYQISEFVVIEGSGVKTAQLATVMGFCLLSLWLVLIIFDLKLKNVQDRFRLVCFFLTLLLSILLIGGIQGRHVPIVTGYYYGCIFPVFFTLLFASIAKPITDSISGLRPIFIVLLAGVITSVQINNFFEINRSFVTYHNVNRGFPNVNFNDIYMQPFTWLELNDIHSAWKSGLLNEYLSQHHISNGAWYLLKELKYIDQLNNNLNI